MSMCVCVYPESYTVTEGDYITKRGTGEAGEEERERGMERQERRRVSEIKGKEKGRKETKRSGKKGERKDWEEEEE